MTFLPTALLFKTSIVGSENGNGSIRVQRKSDHLDLMAGYISTSVAISPGGVGYTHKENIVDPSPEIIALDQIELVIDTADNGSNALVDIEIVGLLTGENPVDGPQYTDRATVEAYAGVSTVTNDQMTAFIKAMSLYIDAYCNRNIFADEVSTYLYDGDYSDILLIKDVCEIESVKISDVAVEYLTYPANKPYASRLALSSSKFPRGRQNVAVRGIQAMNAELPADIQFACTVLVAGILNARNSQGKVGTTERIGAYSVTYRDEAQQTDFATAKVTLSAYKRIAL